MERGPHVQEVRQDLLMVGLVDLLKAVLAGHVKGELVDHVLRELKV